MIQGVVKFRADLHPYVLGHCAVFEKGKVQIVQFGTAADVSPRSAEVSGGGHRECGSIDPVVGALIGRHKAHSGNQIWPIAPLAGRTADVLIEIDRERPPSLHSGNATERPSAEYGIGQLVPRGSK